MQSILTTLQGYGIPRLAALIGGAAGVVAVILALMLHAGGEPQSLLYGNLDPKEASAVTAALDAAGIKYELKGDGATITVPRDKVASSRLLVAGKGLVTSGSVGYEIFDSAPALGQTDFVQHLNQQRALEGELARTIRAIQGVSEARVLLNMPKKQLFEDDADAQASASIMVSSGARRLGAEQVAAIRNLVAGAVPNLKPERVTVADQSGQLLAGAGDAAATGQKSDTEERIRKTVLNIVEGVVGPGRARVQVSADLDMARVTTSEEKFDPDGQVVRSTQTAGEKNDETKPSTSGQVSASQNVPGQTGNGSAADSSKSDKTDETTNYEISKSTRTEVTEPGRVKRLSVAVAVDGLTGPTVKGKPGVYTPRTADEMRRIEALVRSAMGFDQSRGDQVSVLNVRFDQPDAQTGAAAAGLSMDKNDILRGAELAVMLVVAVLLILFVLRPMLRPGAGGLPAIPMATQAATRLQTASAEGGSAGAIAYDGAAGLLSGPQGSGLEEKIDIARIEGQVKATSVKKVAEFVDKHPEESVSLLRGWLHETG